MLTQAEFEALLDRYLAGTSSAADTQLVERWYRQLGQGETPVLAEADQQAVQVTLWARIAQRIQEAEIPRR
jgi:hypothetical protein